MKIRSMKKAVAMLALAVAMAMGAGSAMAVRAGSEYDPGICRGSNEENAGGWNCTDGGHYQRCERVEVGCLFLDWFCTYRWVCS